MSDGRNIFPLPRHISQPTRQSFSIAILVGCGVLAFATSVRAQHVSSEKDILELRLGQRVKVDDGTCPAGQVKEVSGTKMTAQGVERTRKCVPRVATKRK